MKRIVLSIVPILIIGLAALFFSKSQNDEPSSAPISTAPPIITPAADSSAPTVSAAAQSPSPAEQTLLRDTAKSLQEFLHLRSLPDDIENLRKSADIENEFSNALTSERAAFLLKHMAPDFVDSYFGALCLHKWAEADRKAAAEWMDVRPSEQPTTAQALAAGWLAADREGLISFLNRLPAGTWKNNLACTASEDAFVSKNPTEAIYLLGKVSESTQRREQLYEWSTTAWAMKDHTAAVQWVEQSAPPERRQTLLGATAIGYANTDPQAAANWAVTHINDIAALKPAMHAVARIWATKDRSAALQWVDQLPPGPLRDDAADGLIAILKPETNSE